MALHRDIFWVGRQWAVTGLGMQLIDQKLKGYFDIEVARLWDDGLLEGLRAKPWLNIEDFEKALSTARARYPASVCEAAPAPVAPPQQDATLPTAAPLRTVESVEAADPQPAVFGTWSASWRARFLPAWRIRVGQLK
jgi:hypothetical protein